MGGDWAGSTYVSFGQNMKSKEIWSERPYTEVFLYEKHESDINFCGRPSLASETWKIRVKKIFIEQKLFDGGGSRTLLPYGATPDGLATAPQRLIQKSKKVPLCFKGKYLKNSPFFEDFLSESGMFGHDPLKKRSRFYERSYVIHSKKHWYRSDTDIN